jgi:cell wall-associated NlpC family hydrolase
MGRRLLLSACLLAFAPAAGAAASTSRPASSWAAPQIKAVTAAGLMGAKNVASFHPDDPLTAQTLENLVFDLKQRLAPPVEPDPTGTDPAGTDPTSTDPTVTDPTVTDPTITDPTVTDPTVTDPTVTDPTVTDPTVTDPTTTAGTTTTTTAATTAAPAGPKQAAVPGRAVTISQLDARLVGTLGLSEAASTFARSARLAGLKVPARFGTEVVARLLGLRLNHPASQDSLELLPGNPATRAEAAYSVAQVLAFDGSEAEGLQSLADAFTLPELDDWQKRILTTAVARIGMPYIWGGTSDGPETEFGVPSRGGYDCSGFVWRVYKLQAYPDEGTLASVLRGRTTYLMSGEVPRSKRIGLAKLEPADVIFFGDKGPRSQPSQVGHMGLYLGNGWFIHSSEYGVAVARLDGWYAREFAWGRRPLAEAGLTG